MLKVGVSILGLVLVLVHPSFQGRSVTFQCDHETECPDPSPPDDYCNNLVKHTGCLQGMARIALCGSAKVTEINTRVTEAETLYDQEKCGVGRVLASIAWSLALAVTALILQ